MLVKEILAIFSHYYGEKPDVIAWAPGRVNLIGEHTDYNQGFVLPIAINMGIAIAVNRSPGSKVQIFSTNFNERDEADVSMSLKPASSSLDRSFWVNYPLGVIEKFRQKGLKPQGANILIQSDLLVAAGLSSSAALEVANAMAWQTLWDFRIDPEELALLCQAAEHEFVGVQCGIMDQFTSCLAKEGQALLIDCRDNHCEYMPFNPPKYTIAICYSGLKRPLASSEYNLRRRQCQEALQHLNALSGATHPSLRCYKWEEVEKLSHKIEPTLLPLLRHVFTENQRTLEAAKCLEQGDYQQFGQLMYQSHQSLKDDYKVSCRELDLLVELSREVPGVLGARLTGAGFGGSIIALLEKSSLHEFKARIEEEYPRATRLKPETYSTSAAGGARIIFKKD